MNAREQHIHDCRTLAMTMLDSSPLGREAEAGGYYLALFTWLYGEIERGKIPAGVPVSLLERWRGQS